MDVLAGFRLCAMEPRTPSRFTARLPRRATCGWQQEPRVGLIFVAGLHLPRMVWVHVGGRGGGKVSGIILWLQFTVGNRVVAPHRDLFHLHKTRIKWYLCWLNTEKPDGTFDLFHMSIWQRPQKIWQAYLKRLGG